MANAAAIPIRSGPVAEPANDSDAERLRESMSVEGRQVVALERISDQLALIAEALTAGAAGVPARDDAGRPAKTASAETREWENEGGSLAAGPPSLPEGVTRTLFDRYQVGRYLYTDLGSAVAELRRQQASL